VVYLLSGSGLSTTFRLSLTDGGYDPLVWLGSGRGKRLHHQTHTLRWERQRFIERYGARIGQFPGHDISIVHGKDSFLIHPVRRFYAHWLRFGMPPIRRLRRYPTLRAPLTTSARRDQDFGVAA
jgi:hypothetical protein